MRRKAWSATLLPMFVVAALPLGLVEQARSEEGSTFIIAASEGYGVEDCLAERGECGRVVADAWCEAHGHGAAISFGPAEDVTNAIPGEPSATGAPYVVSCSQ